MYVANSEEIPKLVMRGSVLSTSSVENRSVQMAMGDSRGRDEESEPVVTNAQQLLDFDWKLRYVVCSATMAAVNRPLLRLELTVSSAPVSVDNVPYFRRESVEERPEIAVAEYSKTELDYLISQMEAINQALESMQPTF